MNIYIIRHGETKANLEGKMQGWLNTELNELGIELAEETGRNMSGIKFDIAFSSPLKRAYETAEIILKKSNNTNAKIICDDRIKEIHMGDMEGKIIRTEIPSEIVNSFFVNPIAAPAFPNGESIIDVCNRTQAFLHEIVEKYPAENILVSTHGCAMRCLLNFLYEDKNNFWQGQIPFNCAVNIIEYKNGVFTLKERDKIYYDKSKCVDRYAMIR